MAIALDVQRRNRATGGLVRRADGGGMDPTPWTRIADHQITGGLLHSPMGMAGGRSDTLPHSVAANSYIMPADVISGLGMGDTMSGANVMQHILDSMPYGVKAPKRGGGSSAPHAPAPFREARGGPAKGAEKVPVLLANGEFHIGPEYVRRAGNGSYAKGHKVFSELVHHVRQKTISQLQNLPRPVK